MLGDALARFRAHVRSLWPRYALLPPLPFWLYTLFVASRGELRWDHLAFVVLVPALAYGNAATKKLCVASYPMGLVGLFYELMRLVQNVGLSESNVHVCDLRAAEVAWFGITSGGQRMSLHDWLQPRAVLWLDIVCSVPYGMFIFVSLGFALYMYVRDYEMCTRYTWSFLVMNILGFATYHLYPAAPPWYYHAHGCVVDLATKASEGPNLARVDAFLSWPFFQGMYGRSSDVFGAVPSLHVAYPLLMTLTGWRAFSPVARAASVVWTLWMCFAAVYLDHHWVIDVVLGLTYCVMTFLGVGALLRAWRSRAGSTTATADSSAKGQRA